MSTSIIQNSGLNNLFPSVSQDALAQNSIDYTCIFLHNTDADVMIMDLQFWVGIPSDPNFSIAAAVDDVGAVSAISSAFQATTVPTRYIAPQNIGFFIFPETQSEALSLPDLPPNNCLAIWLQRTLLYSGPINSENISLYVSGAVT